MFYRPSSLRALAAGLALVSLCAAQIATAAAGDGSAKNFVAAIYQAYRGKDAKGISLDADADIRRYFAPQLAALIIKDRRSAARRREVGKLDGDPFIDAQDWDIDKLDVDVTENAPGKARATVKFVNLGQPATVVLDLVKIGNEWRIADIIWLREGKPQTLRNLYLR